MMSAVTHPSLDPVTIEYKGPAVQGWNPNSSLAAVVKAVHDEFQANPPMPKHMSMAALTVTSAIQHAGLQATAAINAVTGNANAPVEFQEKQRYCGEQVSLVKPELAELKQRVSQMDGNELSKYIAANNERKELYFEQAEV